MFVPLSFVLLAISASLFDEFRGQVLPEGCKQQEECYETATEEIFQVVEKHDHILPLCEALKNDTGVRGCAAEYGNGSCDSNPWKQPVNALVESLCSEESLRVFSAPQLPQGQCFHLNFAIECVAKSLFQYESIGRFLRSVRNETLCSSVSMDLWRCAAGVYEGCNQKEPIRTALNDVINALLKSISCQNTKIAEDIHNGDQRPTPRAPASSGRVGCETGMTHVKNCLREIVSPNTVANELLEKLRTQPMDYDEAFCRTYESVVECKNNSLSSDCYTKAARSALAKNIKAFDVARNWLCEDERAKLREFAGKLSSDHCNPDDDAITECSNAFIHNVSQSGSILSGGMANKLFQDQLDCIHGVFQPCKSSIVIVDDYLKTARIAFVTVPVSGAPRASAGLPFLLISSFFFTKLVLERVVSNPMRTAQ
ncbi:hypothetical protein MRX96_007168 [Rhipicephalus microplus]